MTWLIIGIVFFVFFFLFAFFELVLIHCIYVKNGGKLYFDEWIKKVWYKIW